MAWDTCLHPIICSPSLRDVGKVQEGLEKRKCAVKHTVGKSVGSCLLVCLPKQRPRRSQLTSVTSHAAAGMGVPAASYGPQLSRTSFSTGLRNRSFWTQPVDKATCMAQNTHKQTCVAKRNCENASSIAYLRLRDGGGSTCRASGGERERETDRATARTWNGYVKEHMQRGISG